MLGPYERSVQYYETDRMGIVHHSNYARWFEEARCACLTAVGLPYDRVEQQGVLMPVLSVSATFRRPFTYNDTFQVFMKVTRFNGVKLDLKYEVYNKGTGELCTTGESSHCFVDRNMKPFNMKKEYPDMFRILSGLKEENIEN